MSYAAIARAAKVKKLADTLASVGIPAHNAKRMTEDQWASVAKCAGCRAPNSEETRQAVYQALEEMTAPKRLTVREWKNRIEAATCS